MRRRTTANDDSSVGGMLSIGALAAATGIPIETIRTWERRYGFPIAERKPSGHRVYSLATVPRLRRVAQAIARGHRAAEVLSASESALDGLLASVTRIGDDTGYATSTRASIGPASANDMASLLDAIRAFDGERLKRSFQRDWSQLGPLAFLETRASPLMKAIGNAWEEKSLDVRHEHFASAVLGDFLRTVRGPLDDRAAGPVVALATLPGELHGLGLHMSAILFAVAGWRALIVGVDTPIAQIVALTREASVKVVALSCVQPSGSATSTGLRGLRKKLPNHVALIVGGAGAPRAGSIPGVDVMPDLQSLDRWLRDAAPRAR